MTDDSCYAPVAQSMYEPQRVADAIQQCYGDKSSSNVTSVPELRP